MGAIPPRCSDLPAGKIGRTYHYEKVPGGAMFAEKCQHENRSSAQIDLDFIRPSEPRAPYSAPVSVLICEECGYIELYAALPRLLCDWLEKR